MLPGTRDVSQGHESAPEMFRRVTKACMMVMSSLEFLKAIFGFKELL